MSAFQEEKSQTALKSMNGSMWPCSPEKYFVQATKAGQFSNNSVKAALYPFYSLIVRANNSYLIRGDTHHRNPMNDPNAPQEKVTFYLIKTFGLTLVLSN